MNLVNISEINPIIIKEFRSRMRGSRAFVTLTISLILMGAMIFGLYRVALASSQYSSSPISPQIGQILFTGLAFFLLFVVAAITPSVTSSEISGEREKQTYEMLITTPISPSKILWGKFVTSMGYVFLLIFAAIPMASLVFIYGGMNARDMIKAFIALLVITLMFGVIGLFFSALFNRTGRAAVASYLVVSLLLFGPILAAMFSGILRQSDPNRWIMTPSPIMVLASTFQPSVRPESISSTFWMLGSPVYWILGSPPIDVNSIPRPAYHYGLPLYGLITIILYFLSTMLIRPVHRWKLRAHELFLAAVILLGYIGILSIGYFATTNRYENIKIISPATATPAAEFLPVLPTPEHTSTPALEDQNDLDSKDVEPVGMNELFEDILLHSLSNGNGVS